MDALQFCATCIILAIASALFGRPFGPSEFMVVITIVLLARAAVRLVEGKPISDDKKPKA